MTRLWGWLTALTFGESCSKKPPGGH